MSFILSMAYLPNIQWMRALLTNNCIIDKHEHFIKQTYRNRTVILSANGPLHLTIPIKKTATKIAMHTLEADNTVTWQRQHWESIKAAYGSSGYFIHYAPYFEKLYNSPITSAFDFEVELLKLIIKLLKVNVELKFSESYLQPSADVVDLRMKISPKKESTETFKPYLQVFAEKTAFVPNLSVLDVLFNYGPQAINYIK